MTQKSVSIRANVSIRGVTIRAYALYMIRVSRPKKSYRLYSMDHIILAKFAQWKKIWVE